MTQILEELYTLLNMDLYMKSPVLSGNMQNNIKTIDVKENEITICIEAPFYDIKKWRKDHKIIYTGASLIDGSTDYALSVNEFGGFMSGNDSMNWVNRSCFNVANIIANKIGGTVINELEL